MILFSWRLGSRKRGYIYINASRETKYCLRLLEGEIILTGVITEGFMEEVVIDRALKTRYNLGSSERGNTVNQD